MRAAHAAASGSRSEGTADLTRRVPGSGARLNQGFGRDKRIRTSAEFEALLRRGMRRSFSGFTFFFSRRPEGHARLGILITRKHAPHAADRNRIKRCIREAFRQVQAGLEGIDLLVRPPYGFRPASGTIQQLKASLIRLPK